MAAQFVDPRGDQLHGPQGRGLICLALTPERCDELGLDLMAAKNESPFDTPFTVSVEAREGVTTGISRRTTARTRSRSRSTRRAARRDLVQPGHVFPLKAKRRRRARAHRPDRGRASTSRAWPGLSRPA